MMWRWQYLILLGVWLISNQVFAYSESLALHVRNSTSDTWYLASYSVQEDGKYKARDGIIIGPRDLKTWQIKFHNLPERWPAASQKTRIGHFELTRSLQKQHQVYNTVDLFIISAAEKERAWVCETFSQNMRCKITTTKTGKVIDLVIGKH